MFTSNSEPSNVAYNFDPYFKIGRSYSDISLPFVRNILKLIGLIFQAIFITFLISSNEEVLLIIILKG